MNAAKTRVLSAAAELGFAVDDYVKAMEMPAAEAALLRSVIAPVRALVNALPDDEPEDPPTTPPADPTRTFLGD